MKSTSQIAHRRLFPSLTDPAYLTLRSRRRIFEGWARESKGQHLRALDIGGRYQPYRVLFNSIDQYVALDLIATDAVSVVADAEKLPFSDASFDMAIATQVFEYFRDPCQTARQIHAALKPGGMLIASFAACTPRFVEEEHWRFTPSGLRLILAPFERVEIVPELHSLAGLLRTVILGLDSFVRYRSFRYVYRFTLCPFLNLLGFALEGMSLTSNDQFTTNYSVRAVKAK
jgi:SAM-dependent methyltransferase